METYTISKKTIEANGLKFDCRISGEGNKKPILLLHGWPETSHMWEPLIEVLAAEGYFCIAPDQRGFSPGARPKGKKNYQIEILAKDALAIADHFGFQQFQLIGHDWGAAIGYQVCLLEPTRVIKYVSMAVPHLQAFGSALNHDPEQKKMSRYMKTFQIPWLPEARLHHKDSKMLKAIWTASSPEQVKEYMTILGTKEGIKASLNYYRANYKPLRKVAAKGGFPKSKVPNLFIWGKNDPAIGRVAAEANNDFIDADKKFVEVDAGHWLVQEAFVVVKKEILDYLD